jgi:putative phosphoesterase
MRPEALEALRGVDQIIHAGDVGGPEILRRLEGLAPVVAVRGNMDGGSWSRELSDTEVVEVDGVSFFVIHDLGTMDLHPVAAGFGAVVSGHTHLPELRESEGVFYINPGSAGPVRPSKPVTLAVAEVVGQSVLARVVPLL